MRTIVLILRTVALISAGLAAMGFLFFTSLGIAAAVIGTASSLCALFAWFRMDDLRELEHIGR